MDTKALANLNLLRTSGGHWRALTAAALPRPSLNAHAVSNPFYTLLGLPISVGNMNWPKLDQDLLMSRFSYVTFPLEFCDHNPQPTNSDSNFDNWAKCTGFSMTGYDRSKSRGTRRPEAGPDN
ncbi:hypothetical protein Landi51_08751 [Colletotrichum acutatum]